MKLELLRNIWHRHKKQNKKCSEKGSSGQQDANLKKRTILHKTERMVILYYDEMLC